MKKLTYIAAGIILLFMSGCTTISNTGPNLISKLTPNPIPKPYDIVNPILPKKETKIPNKKIKKNWEIVANLLKNTSPKGLVMCLKENTLKDDKYVAFNLEDKEKTLVSTFYTSSDPKINEKLCEFYLYHKTNGRMFFCIDATKVLEENYRSKIVIHDFNNNGFRESRDFITYKTSEGKENILREGKLTIEGKVVENANPGKLLLNTGLFLNEYLKKVIE